MARWRQPRSLIDQCLHKIDDIKLLKYIARLDTLIRERMFYVFSETRQRLIIGQVKLWHHNGNLFQHLHYRKGKLDGECKSWYLHGDCRSWYDDGTPHEVAYKRKGKVHGRYRVWHPNGVLQSVSYYHRGKIHGPSYRWYDNGQLSSIAEYKHGKMHGEFRQWSPNGKLGFAIQYKNSNQHGEFIYWNNGAISLHGLCKDGNVTHEF